MGAVAAAWFIVPSFALEVVAKLQLDYFDCSFFTIPVSSTLASRHKTSSMLLLQQDPLRFLPDLSGLDQIKKPEIFCRIWLDIGV